MGRGDPTTFPYMLTDLSESLIDLFLSLVVSIPWNKKGRKYDSKNLFGSHYLLSDASGFELKLFHHQTKEQNLMLQAYIQLAAPGFVF